MKFLNVKSIVAVFLASSIVAACGKLEQGKPTQVNRFAETVSRDSGLRQGDKKWSCNPATPTAATSASVPARKLSILKGVDGQVLQLEVQYTANDVKVVDFLQVSGLRCFHNKSDSRLVKCFSPNDPTLKIESQITSFYEQGFEIFTLKMQGADQSFAAYFGGESRLGTWTEFKARYQDVVQVRLLSPSKCGFED